VFYYELRKTGVNSDIKREIINDEEYLLILPLIPNLLTLILYINFNLPLFMQVNKLEKFFKYLRV
jgi:hypothetical protein